MTTTDFATLCPFCGQQQEAITDALSDYEFPNDGDALICFDCGCVGIFDTHEPGCARKPTKQEQQSLDCEPNVQQALTAWKTIKRRG